MLERLLLLLKEIGDDVAIIRTDADTPHFTFLRRKGVKVGDEIMSPEYTSDVGVFDVRRGTLTDVGHYVKHTGLGRKGNSGSPIYDKNGYMLAIHHSGGYDGATPYSRNVNMGTHIYIVSEFLQANNIKYYIEPVDSRSIVDSENFKKSFAVGIMCGKKI